MTEDAAMSRDGLRQSQRFLLLYALAVAGGTVAYVPFLTLLLPLRVRTLAGADHVEWIAYITFCGAIAASLGNIGFGWLSDVTRSRRAWIVAGLCLSSGLLLAVTRASDLPTLLGIVIAWQLALNMMTAPLAAWAGDCVPDAQKGLLGGLLSFSPALGALVGAVLTLPGLANADQRLALTTAVVVALVVPALLFGSPRAIPRLTPEPLSGAPGHGSAHRQPAAVRMWLARLSLQVAEAALFAYSLFWLVSLDPQFEAAAAARIASFILVLAIPVALLAGRWSDRRGRPLRPLVVCAFAATLGLLIMASTDTLRLAVVGYVVFGLCVSVFLALHSAQTLRVLPRADRRGRDLGIFNLTNTVPSAIMPWLALALIPTFGFDALFVLLACMAALAGLILLTIPKLQSNDGQADTALDG